MFARCLVAAALLGSAPAGARVAPAAISQRILAAQLEANGVPGMAAAVWRDGALHWTGTAGYRNLARRLPVEDSTLFRLASVSKLFAVTAAAKLREQGRLDVDRPVGAMVGGLAPAWPAISSRQLAAHIAGIPHYQAVDAGRGGRRFASERDAVAVFRDRALLSPPGTRYAYSSYGYTLLGAVVEQQAGHGYLDYLASAIVPGLRIGRDRTDSGDPAASVAYDYVEGGLQRAAPHDYSYSLSGAGLGGTAPDLARFGGRLLAGEVVAPATFAWMQEPARLADGAVVRDGDATIGFGWRTGTDADGARIVHHAGVTAGARSVLLLYPERGLAISLLSNAPWVSSIEQTAMMIAAPLQPPGAPAGPASPCPVGATRFAGDFAGQPIDGTARFSIEDGLCVGSIGVANALGEWFNRFPQKDAAEVTIIGLDPAGGLPRGALVTPIGSFDLRRDGAGYAVRFGGSRRLSISFAPAGQ